MADRTIDPVLDLTHALSDKHAMEAFVRRGVLAFVVTFVLGVSGIAAAGVFAGAGDDKGEGNEQDAGVHGGPIERFHDAGSCDLTAVGSLPGNWTHGDYVSAVAANGVSMQIQEAAHSDCGKPMVSVGHGGGPPEHALEHKTDSQAHAGGEPDDEGTDATGS
jgi:hypothetical protein